MAHSEKAPRPASTELVTDSLNCDDFVLTEEMGVIDNTARPMRDSLPIRMGLPPLHSPPQDPPPPELPQQQQPPL